MENRTKKFKFRYHFFHFLSLMCSIAPLLIYGIIGFSNGSAGEKFSLGISIIIALILVLINIILKLSLRSTIWILVLGIYICLDNILPLLLIIAITTIIDEFIFTPLYKSFKNKFIINREIDRRE